MNIDIDIGNMAYSIVQCLFVIDLHALKVFSTRKNICCGRVLAQACCPVSLRYNLKIETAYWKIETDWHIVAVFV
jgi:hypothetical protein